MMQCVLVMAAFLLADPTPAAMQVTPNKIENYGHWKISEVRAKLDPLGVTLYIVDHDLPASTGNPKPWLHKASDLDVDDERVEVGSQGHGPAQPVGGAIGDLIPDDVPEGFWVSVVLAGGGTPPPANTVEKITLVAVLLNLLCFCWCQCRKKPQT